MNKYKKYNCLLKTQLFISVDPGAAHLGFLEIHKNN